jgi:hypothetical protein
MPRDRGGGRRARRLLGVPTFVLGESGELFWDTDRVWLLRERLADKLQQAKTPASHNKEEHHGLVNRATG